MLKEIHFAGGVSTPFGSFCGAMGNVPAEFLQSAFLMLKPSPT
jgi:hypothetical protein